MKWIVILVVLLVIVGALYLRSVRLRPESRGSARHHRLEDSVSRREPATDGDEP